MSSNTYETTYTAALQVLKEKYGFVGDPYLRGEDGKRMCEVQSFLADDNTVFILAWGREAAAKIERQHFIQEPPLLRAANGHRSENPSTSVSRCHVMPSVATDGS